MEEATRLLGENDTKGARSALEKVFHEAEESNDKSLLGNALLLLGKICALENKHGQAVVKFEFAAELFRESGHTSLEIQTLDRLASSYKTLGDESSANEIAARRQAILSSIHSGLARVRLGSQGSALSEGSDATIDSIGTSQSVPDKLFSGIINIFSRDSTEHQKENLLKQIEDGKRFLQQNACESPNNANERFMQRHLMQVHFDNLPFEDVETRVLKTSSSCMDLLEQKATRLYMSLREFIYLSSSSATNGEFANLESPGTLRYALSSWDTANSEFGKIAAAKSEELKEKVLLPLAKVREVYKTICEHFIGQTHLLERRVQAATKGVEQEEASLLKLKAKINDLRSKVSFPGNSPTAGKVTKSFSESMNELLGKKPNQERMTASLNKAEFDLKVAGDAVSEAKERLDAVTGALAASRKRTCKELELIEQARIQVLTELLRKLVKIEREMLEMWQICMANIENVLNRVDAASDIRTYSNRSLIHSVLLGKISPSELFCSNLDKVRQRKDTSTNQTTAESETEDEGESTEEESMEKEGQGEEEVEKTEFKRIIDEFMRRLSIKTDDDDVVPHDEQERQKYFAVVKEMCENFQTRSSREYFLLCLNRFRSTKTRVAKSVMDDLVLLMIAFLDAVYIQGDVKAAKMCLILSETFYTQDEEQVEGEEQNDETVEEEASVDSRSRLNRFYVQDGIKEHAIWKNLSFWEETFYLAVREEVHRNVVRTLRDGKSSRRRSLSSNNYQNIIYAQIGSSAFNMLSVGLPPDEVKQFVERMCEGNGVGGPECSSLLSNLLDPDLPSAHI